MLRVRHTEVAGPHSLTAPRANLPLLLANCSQLSYRIRIEMLQRNVL